MVISQGEKGHSKQEYTSKLCREAIQMVKDVLEEEIQKKHMTGPHNHLNRTVLLHKHVNMDEHENAVCKAGTFNSTYYHIGMFLLLSIPRFMIFETKAHKSNR